MIIQDEDNRARRRMWRQPPDPLQMNRHKDPDLLKSIERCLELRNATQRMFKLAHSPDHRLDVAKSAFVNDLRLQIYLQQAQHEKADRLNGTHHHGVDLLPAQLGLACLTLSNISLPLLWRDRTLVAPNLQLLIRQMNYFTPFSDGQTPGGAGDQVVSTPTDSQQLTGYCAFCTFRLNNTLKDTRIIYGIKPGLASIDFDDIVEFPFKLVGQFVVTIDHLHPGRCRAHALVQGDQLRDLNLVAAPTPRHSLIRSTPPIADDPDADHKSIHSTTSASSSNSDTYRKEARRPESAEPALFKLPLFGVIALQLDCQACSLNKPAIRSGLIWIRRLTTSPDQQPAELYRCQLRDRLLQATKITYPPSAVQLNNNNSQERQSLATSTTIALSCSQPGSTTLHSSNSWHHPATTITNSASNNDNAVVQQNGSGSQELSCDDNASPMLVKLREDKGQQLYRSFSLDGGNQPSSSGTGNDDDAFPLPPLPPELATSVKASPPTTASITRPGDPLLNLPITPNTQFIDLDPISRPLQLFVPNNVVLPQHNKDSNQEQSAYCNDQKNQQPSVLFPIQLHCFRLTNYSGQQTGTAEQSDCDLYELAPYAEVSDGRRQADANDLIRLSDQEQQLGECCSWLQAMQAYVAEQSAWGPESFVRLRDRRINSKSGVFDSMARHSVIIS